MRHRPLAAASLLVLLTAGAAAAEGARPPGFDRALRNQERRAQRQPANPQVLNDLGNLLMLDGQTAAAEEAYRAALAAAPADASARFNLALLLQETGRAKKARQQLERLLEDHPDHSWGHYQLGVVLARRGDRDRAVRHYTRAFVLDPELLEPEVNPHILYNSLRTQAMVRAYREAPPSLTAPRMYENPRQIRRMLVPRPPRGGQPTETEPAESVPTEEVTAPDG